MTHGQTLQRFPIYAMARFYCFSCGFSVVPLWHGSKARVFAGNHSQEWFPCDQHLRKWFCTPTRRGIAIVPGEISDNLSIIDFDVPGSYEAWYAAIRFAAPRVLSARGVHVYVRVREMVKNGKGVFAGHEFGDIIAHGNITAPPSVHPSGHVYRWDGDPRCIPTINALSDIGVERRTPHQAQQLPVIPTSPARLTSISQIKNPIAYVAAALSRETDQIRRTPQGRRNYQLYRSALKLAKYTEMVSDVDIVQALAQAASDAGMTDADDGILCTIHSGLRNGSVMRATSC